MMCFVFPKTPLSFKAARKDLSIMVSLSKCQCWQDEVSSTDSITFSRFYSFTQKKKGKKAQNWCRNSDLKLVLLRLLYGAQNDCVISLETTISWSQENIKCNSSSQENMSDPWPFRASILSAVDRWFERWLASCYFCTYQRLQVTQMLMACPWDPF